MGDLSEGTVADMLWDVFTVKHLKAWIDRNVPILDQDGVETAMRKVAEENPWMVNVGWTRIYNEVKKGKVT